MSARPALHENPLEGVVRLLVDGSNLLHAIRRGAPAAPPATLIGRLRGVIEMPVRIELLFDGPPDQGLRDTRIAAGVTVRYSGRLSADAVLARLVSEAEDPVAILVITDDVDLRREITRRGGRTASARWLIGRLERSRLQAPTSGRPGAPPTVGRPGNPASSSASGSRFSQARVPMTPPSPAQAAAARALRAEGGDPTKDDGADEKGWQPGRGATAKKGNARRTPKAAREATDRPRR